MINEYDAFFSALYSELKILTQSNSFRYLALFVVLLFVVSGMQCILRGFESPFKSFKEEKQIFTEDDIS